MGLLTLYTGLLLPWLGGAFWLVFAESRFAPNKPYNRIRQAGYGFFLGYAVLFLAIMANDSLTATTSWAGLMLFLSAFAGGGVLAVWLTRDALKPPPRPPRDSKSIAVKWLTVLVLVWMAVHLAFIALDIFTQPVYPWDAWLAWVYRAKAWYLAGGIIPVVSPTEWASAPAANTYSIDAWRYPLFPSVIPYWAALSLGRWSETLVNLPVLFAGIAIGMALYGQCREHGLSVTTSLVCSYLLYSIPIFATHLALAGYADIWMAGFTGLGFIAVMRAVLIRGTTTEERNVRSYGMQMVVGLLLLAFAVLVKNEGVVWLLAALSLLILAICRARVPILIVVGIAVLVLLGFATGIHHVDIPLIGKLGIVDGRLAIPFIGNFALEVHNIWRVYWDNFFAMGSWSLFWLLVFTALIISMLPPRSLVKRVGLSFIGVFLATQLFIFGFTDQGLWADTFTAINRLPLHFTPALLFAAFAILHKQTVGGTSSAVRGTNSAVGGTNSAGRDYVNLAPKPANRDQQSWSLLQPTLAALIVLAGLLLYLSSDLPEGTIEPISHPAAGFSFAFGSGHPEQDYMVVDGFANGYALLSSGPVSIQADTHPVLGYTWMPSGVPDEMAFFWRQGGEADNVIRTEITTTGNRLIDLATEPDWQGEIIEFGFLVAGRADQPVQIGPVSLRPDGLGIRLQLMWQAWTTFEERSQQSINFLQGGDHRQVIPLPLLLMAWALTTMLLMRLLPKGPRGSSLMLASGVLFLAAWMLSDVRWTANTFRQARLVLQSPWQADEEQRLSQDLDGEIYQYVQHLKSHVLGTAPSRILIIGDGNAVDYYLLRAKYHLLPYSVDVTARLSRQLQPRAIDYLIFFGQPGTITKVPGWNAKWQSALIEIDQTKWATTYKLEP